MLETIRSRSSGIFAWAIAGLIIVAMALFGLGEYGGQGTDPALYKDGDNMVTLSQYRGALQQAQQRALSQSQSVDIASLAFKRSVLQQLIAQTLVSSLSRDAGYVAADETVAKLIIQNSAFQVDGKFDQETYNQFVATNFGSKDRYEQLLKDSLVNAQVSTGIVDSGLSLDSQKDDLLALVSEKRKLDLVALKIADIESETSVTDEQVQEYYETNKNSFLSPEQISVEILTLSAKGLESSVSVEESELQALYEQNIANYTTPETREIRHILYTGGDAEAKAQATIKELKEGKSFEELAKSSEDTGSGENGGSLGEVSPGQMVEEFEKAAFALPINTVSEPVSTEFGYHVIEVTAINGGDSRPFEEIKEELRKDELAQRSEDLFFEKAEVLRNATFENQDTLQVAADELSLFIDKSGFFTRDEGRGFFANPAIRNTAFSNEVLTENKNSEVIEVTPTEFIVIRKDEYKAEQPKALADIKEDIVNALKNDIAFKEATKKIDEAYAKVVESDDWEGSITSLGLTSEATSVSYLDQESRLPFSVVSEVYSSSDVSFDARIGKIFDVDGNGYLFKLDTIEAGNKESVDGQVTEVISNALLVRNSASVAQNYIREKTRQAMKEVDDTLL